MCVAQVTCMCVLFYYMHSTPQYHTTEVKRSESDAFVDTRHSGRRLSQGDGIRSRQALPDWQALYSYPQHAAERRFLL